MIKRLLRLFFVPFEYLFSQLNDWATIPNSTNYAVLVDIKEYRGKQVALADGTIINSGDLVGEIHVNNNQVRDIDNSYKNLVKIMLEEFKVLAIACKEQDKFKKVKAFYCVTVLYPLIARRGWEVFDMPTNPITFIMGFWQTTLKNVFSVNEKSKKTRYPKKCWISAHKLQVVNKVISSK